ncbi:hypothetical protein DFJ73DRAFT_770082 [Zopfochytrium polystomum]|nr:hypothetical protein DFJ73DRAFT_770082 [Zopfochytrium polystomum]
MTLSIGTDCSGIEAPIEALRQLGISFQHKWSCEIDKYARKKNPTDEFGANVSPLPIDFIVAAAAGIRAVALVRGRYRSNILVVVTFAVCVRGGPPLRPPRAATSTSTDSRASSAELRVDTNLACRSATATSTSAEEESMRFSVAKVEMKAESDNAFTDGHDGDLGVEMLRVRGVAESTVCVFRGSRLNLHDLPEITGVATTHLENPTIPIFSAVPSRHQTVIRHLAGRLGVLVIVSDTRPDEMNSEQGFVEQSLPVAAWRDNRRQNEAGIRSTMAAPLASGTVMMCTEMHE